MSAQQVAAQEPPRKSRMPSFPRDVAANMAIHFVVMWVAFGTLDFVERGAAFGQFYGLGHVVMNSLYAAVVYALALWVGSFLYTLALWRVGRGRVAALLLAPLLLTAFVPLVLMNETTPAHLVMLGLMAVGGGAAAAVRSGRTS